MIMNESNLMNNLQYKEIMFLNQLKPTLKLLMLIQAILRKPKHLNKKIKTVKKTNSKLIKLLKL